MNFVMKCVNGWAVYYVFCGILFQYLMVLGNYECLYVCLCCVIYLVLFCVKIMSFMSDCILKVFMFMYVNKIV